MRKNKLFKIASQIAATRWYFFHISCIFIKITLFSLVDLQNCRFFKITNQTAETCAIIWWQHSFLLLQIQKFNCHVEKNMRAFFFLQLLTKLLLERDLDNALWQFYVFVICNVNYLVTWVRNVAKFIHFDKIHSSKYCSSCSFASNCENIIFSCFFGNWNWNGELWNLNIDFICQFRGLVLQFG